MRVAMAFLALFTEQFADKRSVRVLFAASAFRAAAVAVTVAVAVAFIFAAVAVTVAVPMHMCMVFNYLK